MIAAILLLTQRQGEPFAAVHAFSYGTRCAEDIGCDVYTHNHVRLVACANSYTTYARRVPGTQKDQLM